MPRTSSPQNKTETKPRKSGRQTTSTKRNTRPASAVPDKKSPSTSQSQTRKKKVDTKKKTDAKPKGSSYTEFNEEILNAILQLMTKTLQGLYVRLAKRMVLKNIQANMILWIATSRPITTKDPLPSNINMRSKRLLKRSRTLEQKKRSRS